jgi:hypothetical protein
MSLNRQLMLDFKHASKRARSKHPHMWGQTLRTLKAETTIMGINIMIPIVGIIAYLNPYARIDEAHFRLALIVSFITTPVLMAMYLHLFRKVQFAIRFDAFMERIENHLTDPRVRG